ncbi:hypothetical protein ElyMa_004228400 [Elysia marginata]|uniref:Uncharacterized protein n=1 Tax=Elysia marginata TaxID=1093978 RepID=A0AAV4GQJ2_9GAST|nr:hypothetical protein ElyMa_004228400 [Elysia marginata]
MSQIDSEGIAVRAQFLGAPSGVLTKARPRSIKVYDYYKPSSEASETYELHQVADNEFCNRVGDVGVCAVLLNVSRPCSRFP